jgi:beta-ureidopropionase
MTSFESVESILDEYVPKEQLTQVKRILYGKPIKDRTSEIKKEIVDFAEKENFEIKHFDMTENTIEEQNRKKRIVKIGLIQNQIVKPTNISITEQYEAIQERIRTLITTAGIFQLKKRRAWG